MITRIILFYIISNSFVFSQTPKAELYLQAFRDSNADYPSIAYDIDHIKQNYFSYSYNNSKFYHDVRIIKLSDEKEVSVQTTNYCDDYCFNKNIQFWELNANKLKNITKDILSIEYDTVVFKKVSLEIKKAKLQHKDTVIVNYWIELINTKKNILIGYKIFFKTNEELFIPIFELLYDDKKKKFTFTDI